MMTLDYDEYVIEIFDDSNYTFNSADNVTSYQLEISEGLEYYLVSKYGILVKHDGEVIHSAIIGGSGGLTTIHEKSVLIKDGKLLVACTDSVYAFELPALSLMWRVKADPATCFGLHEFKGDLITHGELEIARINVEGDIKWQFSARDIFVTPDGENSFEINGENIIVTDWEGYKYILDENGYEIH